MIPEVVLAKDQHSHAERSRAASATSAAAWGFVIPVRNDAAGLSRCLSSIKQTCGSRTADIVVVDNGSSDGSADVARKAGCIVLVLPGERVATLRNRGAAETKAEFLAFVDADHQLDEGWLTAAISIFERLDVAVAGAPYSSPHSPTWVQRAYDSMRHHTPGTDRVDWLPSGNLAVRQRVFSAVDGFDSSLEACEDVDFCRRVRTGGGLILSDARLRSIHYGDPMTLRQLFSSELWRGRNNLQVSLRERFSFKSAIGLIIPIYQLATPIVGLIATALGRYEAAAAACAGFLVPSLARALAIRRKRDVSAVQAAVFAVTFDSARALALVMRKQHRRMRPQGHGRK